MSKNKNYKDKEAQEKLNQLLKSVVGDSEQRTQLRKTKKTFRIWLISLTVISLAIAVTIKFLLLDKYLTGLLNILLTFWLFFDAIVFSLIVSLSRTGIEISSIIKAVLFGRLDLIGISNESIEEVRKRAKSIKRVNAELSEVSIRVKDSGRNSRTIVDVVFDCQDNTVRKFSIDAHDSRVSGKHYKRLDDDNYAFIWQGETLVSGDTGVLSYNPEYSEQGFRGFYKNMTVDDFEKISKLKKS